MGIENALVLNETPEQLAERFRSALIKSWWMHHAPGKAWFRKEEALARDWTPEKSAELSDIQKRPV